MQKIISFEAMKKLFINEKYQQLIRYVFWGVIATGVNFIIYISCRKLFAISVVTSNIIAWVLSVAFAYFTNERWVFANSDNEGHRLQQLFEFYAGRLFSLAVEEVILIVFINILGANDGIVKLLAQILVIIINWVISKFWVFK